MVLFFLRHASAGEAVNDPRKDEKRALDDDGALQCRYVGRALAAMGVTVDTVISSPLKRATQTAELVGNEIGYEGKLVMHASLRPEASYDQFLTMVEAHRKSDVVLIVGHNPSLSEFLGRIISPRACMARVDLKKGAVARVEIKGRSGALHWCLTPKSVRAIYESASASSRPKTSRK